MTRGIKMSCCNKREPYLTLRNSNDPNLKGYYKTYCKILSNIIRAAKKLYYNRLIYNSHNKRKTTWNIIKTVTGRKFNNAGIQALNIDRKLTDHHHTITESLNNYFLTIADKINTNNTNLGHSIQDDAYKYLNYLSQALTTPPFPKIKLNYTSTKGIENIIKFLKSTNSNGYDEISVKILKISAPFISSLAHICNRALSTGVFPSRLKYSEIMPLFKNGDRTNMTNYRSISLLSSFSEVVEKVIYTCISD